MPGTVELAAGRLLVAPNLSRSDVPIVDEIVARLGRFRLPVQRVLAAPGVPVAA